MKRILCIGNSFSEDATTHLYDIANSAGIEIMTVNLYIGGCSLQKHWENVENDNSFYDYQLNGKYTERKASIKAVLAEQKWDVVTLHQASVDSGIEGSYFPYIEKLSEYVRELAPTAKIYVLQTWAYEVDSDHEGFARYQHDQKTMHDAVVAAYNRAAAAINSEIIPCGEVIQMLRAMPSFDYQNGGISLCRDGFHMHCPYGRYATALTMFYKLISTDLAACGFIPESADAQIISEIRGAIVTYFN